jgi:MYXO-CTERM domain-containing protein
MTIHPIVGGRGRALPLRVLPSRAWAGRGALAALAVATLCAAAPAAQAANASFSGSADSGPLAGLRFSGAFAYADPAPGFEGSVPLSSWSLSFSGQNYSLLDLDAGTTASARFVGGQMVGIDFVGIRGLSAASAARPGVQFTAGFFQFSEASFSYNLGAGTAGFGGYTVSNTATVPEPSALALAALGLGLVWVARRRRQKPRACLYAANF